MGLVEDFIAKAKSRPVRIVFPESKDPRILAAACKAGELGIAVPIVLGDASELRRMATEKGLSRDKLRIVSLTDDATLDRFADVYARARGLRTAIARKLVAKPLAFGGMMVRTGEADGMVAGAANATASVIQAASLTIGFQDGLSTPSSYFVMIIPEFMGQKDKPLIFADCGMNIDPTPTQLSEIARASATSARNLLGQEPVVAFLSFSTKGSANHAAVDKVREAVRITRERYPDLLVDGELQGDAALVPSVAEKKAKGSPVAGRANVLIFPDLDAGNICYKLVQYLAKAKALGPLLQGFAKPVSDMSRGATVDDIIGITAITATQAQKLT